MPVGVRSVAVNVSPLGPVSSSLAARSLGVSATLPPAATVIARSPDSAGSAGSGGPGGGVPTGTIVLPAIIQPGGVELVGCQFAPLATGSLCVVLPVIATSIASWFTRITGTPVPTAVSRKTILSVIAQSVCLADGNAEHLHTDDRVVVDRYVCVEVRGVVAPVDTVADRVPGVDPVVLDRDVRHVAAEELNPIGVLGPGGTAAMSIEFAEIVPFWTPDSWMASSVTPETLLLRTRDRRFPS